MKKQITALALLIGLVTSGAAVTIEDVLIDPAEPRYNTSVDILSYVDGENVAIESVDVDVRQNGTLIADDVPMSQISGDSSNLAGYLASDTFITGINENDVYTYDLTVQAIDVQGNSDSQTLEVNIRPNGTLIDPTDPVQDTNKIFGFRLIDLLAIAAILIFAWVMLND